MQPDRLPHRKVARRTLARGAAWSVPVVVVAAPAAHAVCSDYAWDVNMCVQRIPSSATDSYLIFSICHSGVCSQTVPTSQTYTLSMKNEGPVDDAMTKASGSGYTIQSSTGGAPGNGGAGDPGSRKYLDVPAEDVADDRGRPMHPVPVQ